MWRALPVLGLMACGDPISNQVLYEDELFLSALPSPDRLAPPSEIRIARVGTSAILESAVGEAASVEGIATVLGGAGDALRDQVPDERTDSVRRWTKPISTAVKIDDATGQQKTVLYQVRGDIVQPAGVDVLDWTIEASPEGSDDWVTIAYGTHARDPDEIGQGTLDWDLLAHVAIIEADDEVPDHLHIEYFDGDEKEPRELSIDDENDLELGGTWSVLGDNVITWLGGMTLVSGEAPAVGGAQVFHAPDIGGRAVGARLTAYGEEPFDICWDPNGNDRYVSGVGLPTVGDEKDCAFEF